MFSLCKLNLLPRILIRVPIVPGTFSYTYAHVNEDGRMVRFGVFEGWAVSIHKFIRGFPWCFPFNRWKWKIMKRRARNCKVPTVRVPT